MANTMNFTINGTKATKREMFEAIRAAVSGNEEFTAFIDHEIQLLANKSSGTRKQTPTQTENEGFKTLIVSYLTVEDKPHTIKELQANILEIADLSNQRITHILSALVNAGTLIKDYVKKVPYYSVAQ